MSIEAFIREDILAPRLARRGVLVVYDPARRCHALRQEMAIAHGLEERYVEPPAAPKKARGRKKEVK